MPVDKRDFLYPMTAGPASMPKKRLSELAATARLGASRARELGRMRTEQGGRFGEGEEKSGGGTRDEILTVDK